MIASKLIRIHRTPKRYVAGLYGETGPAELADFGSEVQLNVHKMVLYIVIH